MKTKYLLPFSTFVLSLFVVANPACAQGTAFTYQGRFAENGVATNGTVEFQFTLWNALSGGTQVASATPASTSVNVTNGLFTAPISFGMTAFDGSDRYLQIEARTTLGPFITLTPRQRVTATPYALLAGKLSGPLSSGSLTGTYGNALTFSNAANVFNGTFIGNGSGLSNVNATSLVGTVPSAALSNAWKLGGNAGATAGANFLGTTDNQPLELKVGGQRAFRLEPIITITNVVPGASIIWSNAPNVIGGSSLNVADVDAIGAFIGGGGLAGYYINQGAGYVFAGTFTNHVSAALGTITGGGQNTIQAGAYLSSVGGGLRNTIQSNSTFAIIGGGYQNTIQTNSPFSAIAGGQNNTVQGSASTIGGGNQNTIQSESSNSTIGGGEFNTINNANSAMMAGGSFNSILEAPGAFMGAGGFNVIGGPAPGGDNSDSVICGGFGNLIHGDASRTFIGGGESNTNYAQYGMIGGGRDNLIGSNAFSATIAGGFENTALGSYSFAAGRQAKANHDGAFVWADSQNADFGSTANNQFLIRASGGVQLSDTTPSISFGTTTRQMLNFYGPGFGVGVQTATLYARSNTRFSWYKDGSHSDTENDPGPGGVRLMTLTTGGLTVNGTFVSASDRDAKEKFEPLNPREVLDKVATLPLSKWSYKQDSATRHLGPMAQDFYAAFAVGPDDKHIATVDADGVALAAIQGLNEKLNEKLKAKDAEIEALKGRLEAIEKVILSKTAARTGMEQ